MTPLRVSPFVSQVCVRVELNNGQARMMLEDCSYCSRGEGVLSSDQKGSQFLREKVERGFPDESIDLFSALPGHDKVSQVTERSQAQITVKKGRVALQAIRCFPN